MVRSWTLNDIPNEVAIGAGPRSGVVMIVSRRNIDKEPIGSGGQDDAQTNKDNTQYQPTRWRSVFFPGSGIQMPRKLLTGPWTEEKPHFLENLPDVKQTSHDTTLRETASTGLMDAIEENNYRAVDLLVAETRMKVNMPTSSSGMGIFAKQTSSFKITRGIRTYYVENHLPHSIVGVQPTTKRLKTAIKFTIYFNDQPSIIRRLFDAERRPSIVV
ncbi:MAG: hypothetical protein L6R41_007494 [Letrouitia leprolyta]|nr:MAG: hypothetical protein L6R41_007494 [Letrouitia leprolyta]